MAILAGIDEAGYGPMLGPLVVTGAAFEVPDDALDGCLWARLSASVTERRAKRDHRLPIVDSKKLYQRSVGLKMLERTALVMASVAEQQPATVRALLERIAPHAVGDVAQYPWYFELDRALPTENDRTDIAMRANAVRRDLADNGVRFIGAFAEPLPEGHFNRLVERTRNKAVASLGLVFRIIDRIVRTGDAERVRICVDRQGGRQHYRSPLSTAFDGHDVQIMEEAPERSAYQLRTGRRQLDIEFTVDGEREHLPVALASVFSKYVRELLMSSFNRYWAERIDGLKPTAGYYQDARRFLEDIAPALAREGTQLSSLVRNR